MMNKKIVVCSLLMLIGNVWATIDASVDRNQLSLGQSFTLTINLPDSGTTPEIDTLKNNFDLFGTSSSSQTSIINGKVTSHNSFIVNLMPKHAGRQTIPPIKVGNDTTRPITIEVLAANTTNANNNQSGIADAGTSDASSIYVTAAMNARNLYVGVPFLYTIKLYFSIPLSNLSIDPINLDNARVEPKGKAIQYQSTENGKSYQVIEQQFMITPTKAGGLLIPPAHIKGMMNDNSGNDIFAIASGKPFMANSKPLQANVLAIPATIPVNEWLPAKELKVNDNWSINSAQIKVGEPLTHTISLEAIGIAATSIPELQFTTPDGVNVYPDKPQSNTNTDNDNLVGSKTFKIAYIPTKAGKLNFPAIDIKWWDIGSNSLKTVTIAAKSYTVIANSNYPAANDGGGTTSNNKSGTQQANIPVVKSLWFYLALVFASLWLITIGFALKVYCTRRSTNKELPTSIEDNNFAALDLAPITAPTIHASCKKRDIHMLNQALITWAKSFAKTNIYTINDIKIIFNDERLNRLLDNLSAAMYKSATFDEFNELEATLKELELTQHQQNKKPILKDLYPRP